MRNFTYFRPATAEQAVALLETRWGNTELLAGGTDLLDLQKEYVVQPGRIVSLSAVKGLVGIQADGKSIRIGAGTKLADIASHAAVRQHCRALADAADMVGGPQIRNMGTLGGNLCQRNRCWYFRDEHTPCLIKGGDRCYAINGENKYHAIFTQGHPCVIVHPSTLAPALIALGAMVEIQGPKERRTVEVGQLFRAPTRENSREHTVAPNEVVLSVTIPIRGLASASYEVRHKQAYDWPLVQAAVSVPSAMRSDDKTLGIKIVLGHVAPTPLVSEAAATAIAGRAISEEVATAAGRAAAQNARPLSQNAYKVRLVEVAVKRALLLAAGQKPYWES
jgi:xanthine dehydrogenase YagS FAD-binding subunit